jgi:hypothetical protein
LSVYKTAANQAQSGITLLFKLSIKYRRVRQPSEQKTEVLDGIESSKWANPSISQVAQSS